MWEMAELEFITMGTYMNTHMLTCFLNVFVNILRSSRGVGDVIVGHKVNLRV